MWGESPISGWASPCGRGTHFYCSHKDSIVDQQNVDSELSSKSGNLILPFNFIGYTIMPWQRSFNFSSMDKNLLTGSMGKYEQEKTRQQARAEWKRMLLFASHHLRIRTDWLMWKRKETSLKAFSKKRNESPHWSIGGTAASLNPICFNFKLRWKFGATHSNLNQDWI